MDNTKTFDLQQVVYALERQIRSLMVQSTVLAERGDYNCMFPESDALMLRNALELVNFNTVDRLVVDAQLLADPYTACLTRMQAHLKSRLPNVSNDDDEPSLLETQLDGLLTGDGATDDHKDVLAGFRSLGLTEPMVNRVHRAIVCAEVKTEAVRPFSFAVFDEFGNSVDDQVQDFAHAAYKRGRQE